MFPARQKLLVPEGVTSIAQNGFFRPEKITRIIPESVQEPGTHVFENCSSMTVLEIRGPITEFSQDSVANCTALTTLILPDTVVTIGKGAFSGCGLKELTLLSGVRNL